MMFSFDITEIYNDHILPRVASPEPASGGPMGDITKNTTKHIKLLINLPEIERCAYWIPLRDRFRV